MRQLYSIALRTGLTHITRLEISVQVVETSLVTAVSFVMDLEERDLVTFGPRPDPTETSKDPRRNCFMSEREALVLARKHG